MQIVIDKENLITMFAMVLYAISGNPEYDDAINVVTELLEKIGYTPLPKGHGRLIDADELEECKEIMNTISGESKYAVRMDDIRNAPTIIEADKGADNG